MPKTTGKPDKEKPMIMECGYCYTKYDIKKHDACPNCGSDELIGLR